VKYALTDIAYAAGLFDGEGHVQVKLTRGRPSLVATIVGANREMHDWLVRTFGGKSYVHGKPGKHRATKTSWAWVLHGAKAAEFLLLIQPYLIEKRRRVDAALVPGTNWGAPYGNGRPVPEGVLMARMAAREAVHAR